MKAIIPAAGFGSRFLPATKAVPKEMLPIGDKPALQIIVEEAVAAGADEVLIITSDEKPAIMHHFTPDNRITEHVASKPEILGKLQALDELSRKVKFTLQTEQKGLGHAVLQAADFVAGEKDPVLILLGDALVSSQVPCSVEIAALSRKLGNVSIVGLERVPREKVSRYGIVAGEEVEDSVYKLSSLVEKPTVESAPSDLAIAGRYLLHPDIFKLLAEQKPGFGGEIQLTDSIRTLLKTHPIYGYRYPGRRLDIGNPKGYLEAIKAFSDH